MQPNLCEIVDPVLLLNIARLYQPGMSDHALYEATRGVWVVSARRSGAKFALAVFQGVVQEVYAIDAWYPAGTLPYTTRGKADIHRPGHQRWEFAGRKAPANLRTRYLKRNVAAYFPQGAANPVRYVNV